MALNKDILGLALHNRRLDFCDKTYDQLIATYGSMDNARLEMAKADADEIIKHFKNNIQITIPALGLISASPGSPVTGSANTGSIL